MLKDFMSGIPTEVFKMDDKALLKEAITKEARQQLLEAFFRRVFYQVIMSKFLLILNLHKVCMLVESLTKKAKASLLQQQ